MAIVTTDNKHYKAIANAIRDSSFGYIEGPIPPSQMAGCIEEISEVAHQEGIQSQYDRFWDAYQSEGLAGTYGRSFSGPRWTDETFKPKYDIIATSIEYAFQSTGVTDIPAALERQGVIFDSSQATNVTYAFNSNKIRKVPVVSTVSASDLNTLFGWAPLIVTIEKLILKEDGSQTFQTSTFHTCNALENIVIEGKIGSNNFNVSWSTKLTHDSLMSIINAFQDKTDTGTTWIATLGTANLAKLTDTEKAIATQKGWTLA